LSDGPQAESPDLTPGHEPGFFIGETTMRTIALVAALGLAACSVMPEPTTPTPEQIERAARLAQQLAEIARQIGGAP